MRNTMAFRTTLASTRPFIEVLRSLEHRIGVGGGLKEPVGFHHAERQIRVDTRIFCKKWDRPRECQAGIGVTPIGAVVEELMMTHGQPVAARGSKGWEVQRIKPRVALP